MAAQRRAGPAGVRVHAPRQHGGLAELPDLLRGALPVRAASPPGLVVYCHHPHPLRLAQGACGSVISVMYRAQLYRHHPRPL